MSLNTVLSDIIGKVFDDTLVSGLSLTQSATYISKNRKKAFDVSKGTFLAEDSRVAIKVVPEKLISNPVVFDQGTIQGNQSVLYFRPIDKISLEVMTDDQICLDSLHDKLIPVEELKLGDTVLTYKAMVEVVL